MLKVSSDSSLLKHSDKQLVGAQRPWSPVWHHPFTAGKQARREVAPAQGPIESRGKARTST